MISQTYQNWCRISSKHFGIRQHGGAEQKSPEINFWSHDGSWSLLEPCFNLKQMRGIWSCFSPVEHNLEVFAQERDSKGNIRRNNMNCLVVWAITVSFGEDMCCASIGYSVNSWETVLYLPELVSISEGFEKSRKDLIFSCMWYMGSCLKRLRWIIMMYNLELQSTSSKYNQGHLGVFPYKHLLFKGTLFGRFAKFTRWAQK